jgi:hypothetical protein
VQTYGKNWKLSWFLEANGHMHEEQYGFRKNRSTADCLIAVSFDLEKAYDTACVRIFFATSPDSQSKEISSIQNFMANRTF